MYGMTTFNAGTEGGLKVTEGGLKVTEVGL